MNVRVSDDGHYLVDDDDQPFFYLADTSWYVLYRPNKSEVDLYLENRASKGFNVFMPVVVYNKGLLPNFQGETCFEGGDPTRPNEAFFKHVDYVVRRAEELGIVTAMLPTWGEMVCPLPGDDSQIFDIRSARIYGEFLGRRYRDHKMIWVLGGDHNPHTQQHLDIWRAMVDGIKAGDQGRHLMTYHPRPERRGDGERVWSSADWLHDEPWLDFNMQQTTTRWDLNNFEIILKDRLRTPAKPVLDGETRYENSHESFNLPPAGRRITPHQIRKGAYNALLAGACGHTYGCRDVWSFYTGGPPERDVSTHWKIALDWPGSFQLAHLKSLFQRYPWYRLVPDAARKVVVHGCRQDGTYVPAAVAQDKSFALVYVPESMPVHVDLSVLGGGPVDVSWFNPRNGSTVPVARYPEPSVQRYYPPTGDPDPDYVLILEAVEKQGGSCP